MKRGVIAWAMWLLVILLLGASIVLLFGPPPGADGQVPSSFDVALPAIAGALATAGASITWRTRNGVGPALLGAALLWTIYFVAKAFGPYSPAISQITGWIWLPAMWLSLFLIPLLYPTGRLQSTAWKYVAAAGGAAAAGATVALATGGALRPEAIAAMSAIGPITLGVRLPRASPRERLQIKWLATAAVPAAIAAAVAAAGANGLGWPLETALLPSWFAIAVIPLAAGTALAGSQLRDLGSLTASIVAVVLWAGALLGMYAATLTLLIWITRSWAARDLVVAASTLAVAVASMPLRRALDKAVKGLLGRKRRAAAAEVERFHQRISIQPELQSLHRDLQRVVRTTMDPERSALWVRPTAGMENRT